MPAAVGAIVVRRAERLGNYRDAVRGDALVLDQIAHGSPSRAMLLAAGGLPFATAAFLAIAAPSAVTFASLALGALGGATGASIVRSLRWRSHRRASLIIEGSVLRLFRAPALDRPALELASRDLARIEVLPRTHDDGWALVAIDGSSMHHELLHTADRGAALRVRTLLVERLARDGAFEGTTMHTARCPACATRITMPLAWLPTRIACTPCGAEGLLTAAR